MVYDCYPNYRCSLQPFFAWYLSTSGRCLQRRSRAAGAALPTLGHRLGAAAEPAETWKKRKTKKGDL